MSYPFEYGNLDLWFFPLSLISNDIHFEEEVCNN